MTDNTEKKKRNVSPTTLVGSFPVGDAIATVKLKASRSPTVADLRHSVSACAELKAQLEERLAEMSKGST